LFRRLELWKTQDISNASVPKIYPSFTLLLHHQVNVTTLEHIGREIG